MAFTLSQPLYGQGGSYTAQQDRLLINADVGQQGVKKLTAASGGVMTGDLAVTTTGTGNGSVSVASGDVFVRHTTSGQGMYYAFNDAATTVGSFAANSSGNPRIDLVCVLVTDTGATPSVAFSIVQGTPAASPVAPTPPASSTAHYLTLAQVTIPNGFTVTTTVAAGNIVDVRTKALIPDLSVQGTASATGTLPTNVPSPSDGQLLYSSTGKHLIAYNGTTSAFEGIAPTAGMRNFLINGSFDIWQRGTSITPASGFGYGPDRWRTYSYAASASTISQQTFTPGSPATNAPESRYFARVRSTSTQMLFSQVIEGVRSFTTSPTTVSFWAKASSGTPTLGAYAIQYFGTGGSPSASVQTTLASFTLSTSWTRYQATFTLPSISGKTIGTNNDDGIDFFLASSTLNVDFDFWGVQIENGAVASPFERRSIGAELQLCQRYFERINSDSLPRIFGYTNFNGAVYNGYFSIRTTQRMRTTIAVTASSGNTSGAVFNTVQNTTYTNGGLNYTSQGDQGFLAFTVNAVGSANGQLLSQATTVYDVSAEW